jgi:RNA polymerase sigma factor for flagellar operon FliA
MSVLAKEYINIYKQNEKMNQDTMVLQYMPAVKAMAYRLKERLPSSVDVNDLISIGTEEMIKLSRRYDSSQNDSFWGYGKKRVYGSMLDYLRSLDVVSRSNRRIIKAIDDEINRYMSLFGEEPDNEHLAEVLGESEEKINEARIASDIYVTMPINEQLVFYSDGNIEEEVEREQLIEAIKGILHEMKEREQLVIQLYYFEELNLKEISSILDISESRISQINKKVIRKIRESLGDMYG